MMRLLLIPAAVIAAFGQPKSCESIQSLSLPHTTIGKAEMVAAAPFRAPGPGPAAANPQPGPILPAHCRVAASIEPVTDSHIEIEVWMPAENWNGKFEAVGNGGFSGAIGVGALAAAVREGYAAASTDTGHKGGSASFALGHPEKMVDFGYRAVHEMTEKAKAIVQDYYGRAPRLSYWNGCSTGGRQGLKEGQRFPEDFDAILAGAPANYETHLHAWTVEVGMAAIKNNENILPVGKLPLINQAVIEACDALDGVKDGLLTDPRRCRFDPAKLQCSGADTGNCLTAEQVEAVRRIYAPARTKSGALIFPSFEPGSELGWGGKATGNAPPQIGQDTFMYLTYADPKWDWHTFDLDRDTAAADEKDGGIINAIDPDLSRFKAHGGKLLLYHGWNDTAIAPENTIKYYESVLKKMGPDQSGWMRLFMAPGVEHCGGGPGPNQFSMMGALERWRESGTAPDQITAWHVSGATVDRSHPLCPYPQVAVWKGVGSINDAANFTCKLP